MFPKQLLRRCRLRVLTAFVLRQKIANKSQIVWKAVMRIAIDHNRERHIRRRRLTQILFQLGSGKDSRHHVRQHRVIHVAPLAQIESCQLAVPARSAVARLLELRDSPLVDLILACIHAVLIEKLRQLVIQARVFRIAVQFSAHYFQRIGQPPQGHQPREIAIQHVLIVGRARRARSLAANRFAVCASRRAQRNAVGLGRKLLQQIFVKRKFFFCLKSPAVYVAHCERHFNPARVGRELRKKQRSLANHGIVFCVGHVGRHQLIVQLGPFSRFRKAPVNLRQQFGSFGAMKVRHGKLILRGILRSRLL